MMIEQSWEDGKIGARFQPGTGTRSQHGPDRGQARVRVTRPTEDRRWCAGRSQPGTGAA